MSIIPGSSIKFKYITGIITQSNFDIQISLMAMTSTISIINLYYFAVRPPSYTFSASLSFYFNENEWSGTDLNPINIGSG